MSPSINPKTLSQLEAMGFELNPGGAHFMGRDLFQKSEGQSDWQATGHQLIAAKATLVKTPIFGWNSANLVVVGDQIYVDARITSAKEYTHLPSTRYFTGESTLFSMAGYSGVMQYLVQEFDFKTLAVVELGSADGHASMVAKIRGAKQVVAVECDSRWEWFFGWNRTRYALSSCGIQFWCEDFTHGSCVKRLERVAPQAIIANVGPLYPCHGQLIQLVCALPVQWFIAGGYVGPNPEGDGERCYPTNAMAALEKAGFRIVKQALAVATMLGFKDEDCPTRKCPTLGFVAHRP